MKLPRIHPLSVAALCMVCLFAIYAYRPTISFAESIQIFATVAPDVDDFQLELAGPDNTNPIGPDSVLTFTLKYGSYLSQATDLVVVQISWTQGQLDDGQIINVLEYVEGSASTAFGNAQPIIDLTNRTITWQISPLPPGVNHSLSWQLRTKSVPLTQPASFTVSASLISPGLEKQAIPLEYIYLYTAPVITPTPTPVNPTTTPMPPATGGLFNPIIDLINKLVPVATTVTQVTQTIAEHGGAIVATPIPVLLILIPAIAQIAALLGQVPWWQIIPLVTALFWSRPKRPWGLIYDTETKQPIDPAIITLTSASSEQRTTLSDFYGRYQFLVEPGVYELSVKKSHYQFPSQQLNGQQDDGIFSNLYFGGPITINEVDAITYNIPLDPVTSDWNQTQKQHHHYPGKRHLISEWLFWLGLAWSILMFSLSASLVNAIVLGMYLILLGLRWLQRLRSPWGVVYDQYGYPMAGAVVSITNINNPLVKRPPVVTNQSGRYAFLVERGMYQLNVAVNSRDAQSLPNPGPMVEVKKPQGHIALDLTVSDTKHKS